MTRDRLITRLALLVAVMVALLSTGLPGAVHRSLAHGHETHTNHACEHTAHTHHQHADQPGPVDPDDRDRHDDHDCQLCLMLATGGQWGVQIADAGLIDLGTVSRVEWIPVAVIDSLPVPARLARGPPTPICAG